MVQVVFVLVLCPSLRKYGVCFENVGKLAFFGCSEFQYTKFTCKFLMLRVFWPAVILKIKTKTQMFCRSIIPLGALSTDGQLMTKQIKEITMKLGLLGSN